MSDWIHAGLPLDQWACEVWLQNGEVRRVKRNCAAGAIYFTDCRHPLQNVWCNPDTIKAWRLVDEQNDAGHENWGYNYAHPDNWLGEVFGAMFVF